MINPLRLSISTRSRDRFVIKFLKPTASDVILDLGCGIGYYCEFLSNFGSKVFGVDIDQEASYIAQQFCPDVDFSICSATDLPFKENSFDKIICTDSLEHVEDDYRAINEIYRVTKPGGLVLLTIPCNEGVFGSFTKNIAHEKSHGYERHVKEGYSFKDIVSLCEHSGFKLLNHAYTLTFFAELFMALSKLIYLLINKGKFKGQSELITLSNNRFFYELVKLLLLPVLIIGQVEDILLSRILKGHCLVLLLTKGFIIKRRTK
ncbi:MAG: class I SAM-dependent methyltransferase [Candidatus Omnitrophota bacterium]